MQEIGEITTHDVEVLLDIKTSRSRELLGQLVTTGKINAKGDNKNRTYYL